MKYYQLLITLLLFPSVLADMPPVHEGLDQIAIDTYTGPSTKFYEAMINYPDLVFVGNMYTDFSVAYYYVGGGVKYEITHSPGFCTAMLDNAVGTFGVATQEEEFACAVGSCVHAAEDIVSHTTMVPYAIRHTGLPNNIIHVPAEQHRSNLFLKRYPELTGKLINNLTEESWNKCIPLLKRTLQGYNEYEDDLREGKTDDLINYFIAEVMNSIDPSSETNYDIAFRNKVSIFGRIGLVQGGFLLWYLSFMFLFTVLFILSIFKKGKRWNNYLIMVAFLTLAVLMWILFISLLTGNAFVTLIWIIKPFSNLVPIGSFDTYTTLQVNNVHSLLAQGESFIASIDNPIIASGFTELAQADRDIRFISYIWFIIPLIILLFLIWINFKKPKRKQNYSSL